MAGGERTAAVTRWVNIIAFVAALVGGGAGLLEYRQSIVSSRALSVEVQSIERLQELALQSSEERISPTEAAFARTELQQIRRLLQQESKKEERENVTFYVKLIFSVILGGAALFVILSRKYDKETKKWAISVLTLISGVWIGSATS